MVVPVRRLACSIREWETNLGSTAVSHSYIAKRMFLLKRAADKIRTRHECSARVDAARTKGIRHANSEQPDLKTAFATCINGLKRIRVLELFELENYIRATAEAELDARLGSREHRN